MARKAIALFEQDSDARNLARLRTELANMQLRQDPPEAAEAKRNLERAALELDWSSASPMDKADNQLAMARATLLLGDPEAAADLAASSFGIARGQAPLSAAEALVLQGQILAARTAPRKRARPTRRRSSCSAASVPTGVLPSCGSSSAGCCRTSAKQPLRSTPTGVRQHQPDSPHASPCTRRWHEPISGPGSARCARYRPVRSQQHQRVATGASPEDGAAVAAAPRTIETAIVAVTRRTLIARIVNPSPGLQLIRTDERLPSMSNTVARDMEW